MICPECNGKKEIAAAFKPIVVTCPACDGTGIVDDMVRIWKPKGEKMKEYRLKTLHITLRQAWKRFNIDPATLSSMERGLIEPKIDIYKGKNNA